MRHRLGFGSQRGYIKVVPGTTQTSVPGVFDAGDVQASVWRQAVMAAAPAAWRRSRAERYLAATQAG